MVIFLDTYFVRFQKFIAFLKKKKEYEINDKGIQMVFFKVIFKVFEVTEINQRVLITKVANVIIFQYILLIFKRNFKCLSN